jgi:hypothetical protein
MSTLQSSPLEKQRSNKFSLTGNPYELSPLLNKLNDSCIESLFRNCCSEAQLFLFSAIQECKTSNSLHPVLYNPTMVNVASRPARLINVARRTALQVYSSWFSGLCIAKTAGVEPNMVHRMWKCPPIGMNNGSYNCRSFFCPGCRMRDANKTVKQFRSMLGKSKGYHEDARFLLVSCDIAFSLRSFGYEPVLDDGNLLSRITRNCKGLRYTGCKVMGLLQDGGVPYYALRIGIHPAHDQYENVKVRLDKLKTRIIAGNPQISSLTLAEVKGLDGLCLQLYDPFPISISTMGDGGFSNCMLQHTVNEVREAVKGMKKTAFFGTGE